MLIVDWLRVAIRTHTPSFVRDLPSAVLSLCLQLQPGNERPVGRKRKKVRTRRLEPEPPSSPPGQKWSKQVRRRRQKWKRLREVLQLHQFIPEAEEFTLIDLAEMEGVKDNDAGLEGWTVDQLLQKVSEGATGGFELLACAGKISLRS